MLQPNFRRPLLNTEIRRRGIYLLPNLFTTAALFAGFYAIVMAMSQRFDNAAVAVFIAMILDTLDGRVARLTRTQSAFGAEYDSLSDMVCFGAAPALIIYEWALKDLGRFGWIAAFVYCAGAALRLARFNTNIDVIDKRFFQGLPSPAAAALVAGFLWLASDNKIPVDDYGLPWVAAFLTLYAGLTMVSNVPFYSFKDINLRRSVPFAVILLVVLGFVLISTDPPIVLFVLVVEETSARRTRPVAVARETRYISPYAFPHHCSQPHPRQPASGGPAAAPRAHIIPNPIRQYPVAAQAGAAERSQAFDAEQHHERTVDHIRHHHARRRAEPRCLDDQGREAAHCAAAGAHARGCDRGGLPGLFERRFRGGAGGCGRDQGLDGGRSVPRQRSRHPARDRCAQEREIRTHSHFHRDERAPYGEEAAHDARASA